MNVRFFAAALLLGLAACQPKPAPAPADPKTFIATLYAKCQASKAFTVLGADAASYFDPATLALMGPDARLTPPGQVGIWQADPFCAFGEYSDIHPGFVIKSATATTAVVEADMHPEDKDDPGPSFTYSLTLVNGQWRLSDIARPSLRSIVADAHAATPLDFMQGLYGHYVSEFSTGQWDFSPLNDVAPAYFDPDMLALMSEDQRLNAGQVGALDGDPVCGCQDTYKMQVTFTVKAQTATAATIVAHVGGGGPAVVDRTFQLVSTGGRWRIHDISDPDIPSLRELFITSNRQAAAALAADEQGLGTPDGFLSALYTHYHATGRTPADFDPAFHNPQDYFDPEMVAFMKKSDAITEPGNSGALDFDPICNCQDDVDLAPDIRTTRQTATSATAEVVLPYGKNNHLTFSLVRVGGKWRIHDIDFHDQWGLTLRKIFLNYFKQVADYNASASAAGSS